MGMDSLAFIHSSARYSLAEIWNLTEILTELKFGGNEVSHHLALTSQLFLQSVFLPVNFSVSPWRMSPALSSAPSVLPALCVY